MIARLCELYDRNTPGDTQDSKATGKLILDNRRFGQLVECVLCGVDVNKRKLEALEMRSEKPLNSQDIIETLLDGDHANFDEGLSVADSCRAAWGLAILCGYNLESFGGENVHDILIALSLRIRDLLLDSLQKLRPGEVEPEDSQKMSLTERFERNAELIAKEKRLRCGLSRM